MKTRDYTSIQSSHLPGESAAFTIQASAKAFRALIDTLYTNKQRAVLRELLTNAYDAHIAAGIPDTPVEVTLPNEMSPTLIVRDFGIGMSKDTVLGLYSTLFASSKDTSNDQVGMIGIGSKSPFAVTDTYVVITAHQGEKNTFQVHMTASGVPAVTHVKSEPTTETGTTVRVPVTDVQLYRKEMTFVALGFPVRPKVSPQITVPTPSLVLDNGAIEMYERRALEVFGSSTHYVRQGSVLYPVQVSTASNDYIDPYYFSLIVTVPIGTVDVAISREALSLDNASRKAVDAAFNDACSKARAEMSKQFDITGLTPVQGARLAAKINNHPMANVILSSAVRRRYSSYISLPVLSSGKAGVFRVKEQYSYRSGNYVASLDPISSATPTPDGDHSWAQFMVIRPDDTHVRARVANNRDYKYIDLRDVPDHKDQQDYLKKIAALCEGEATFCEISTLPSYAKKRAPRAPAPKTNYPKPKAAAAYVIESASGQWSKDNPGEYVEYLVYTDQREAIATLLGIDPTTVHGIQPSRFRAYQNAGVPNLHSLFVASKKTVYSNDLHVGSAAEIAALINVPKAQVFDYTNGIPHDQIVSVSDALIKIVTTADVSFLYNPSANSLHHQVRRLNLSDKARRAVSASFQPLFAPLVSDSAFPKRTSAQNIFREMFLTYDFRPRPKFAKELDTILKPVVTYYEGLAKAFFDTYPGLKPSADIQLTYITEVNSAP